MINGGMARKDDKEFVFFRKTDDLRSTGVSEAGRHEWETGRSAINGRD